MGLVRELAAAEAIPDFWLAQNGILWGGGPYGFPSIWFDHPDPDAYSDELWAAGCALGDPEAFTLNSRFC